MNKHLSMLLCLIVIAASWVAVQLYHGDSTTSSERIELGTAPHNGPSLQLDKVNIDLGKVAPLKSLYAEVALSNVGDSVLKISNLKTSCGCAPAKIDETAILPGTSAIVSVASRAPASVGRFSHVISFSTNDPLNKTVSVPMFAIAQWAVQSDPIAVRMSDVLGVASQEVELYSPDGTPFEVTKVVPGDSWVSVEQLRRRPRRTKFSISVRPPHRGRFSSTIRFATNSEERPTVIVPIEGESIDAVTVSPKAVLLGSGRAASQHIGRVVIRSREVSAKVNSVFFGNSAWKVIDWNQERIENGLLALSFKVQLPEVVGTHRSALNLAMENHTTTEVLLFCTVNSLD